MDIKSVASPHPVAPIADKSASEASVARVIAKAAAPVETANAIQQPPPVQNLEQVAHAIEEINKTMQAMSQDLEFSVDHDTNQTIVKVIDQKTKEVIRQMPTQEALEIAKALDKVQGLLISQKA